MLRFAVRGLRPFYFLLALVSARTDAQRPTPASDTLKLIQARVADSISKYAPIKARLEARTESLVGDTTTAGRLAYQQTRDSLATVNRLFGAFQGQASQINTAIASQASDSLRAVQERMRSLSGALASTRLAADSLRIQKEQVELRAREDSLKRAQREVTVRELTKLKTNVAGWENLGGVVSTVSLTAQQLLIFPEADSGWVSRGRNLFQWIGLGAGVAGSIVAGKGNVESGSAMTGGGLALSAFLQKIISSNSSMRQIATRVARNAGFTDDVNSLANLTPTFRADAEGLRGQLDALNDVSLPTQEQLNTYYKLVSQQGAIFGVLVSVRAKAQFLLDAFGDDVTPKSKGSLQRLIQEADRATSRWYTYEPVLLQPYEYILSLRRGF